MPEARTADYPRWARPCQAIFLSLAAMVPLGCGKGAACHPVSGQILLGSAPVAEAKVVFHPLDGQLPGGQRPQAITDDEGRFTLMTQQPGDGAPEGEYAITVELREPVRVGEEVIRDGRNLLPDVYSRPESSKLRYRVHPGGNTAPAIILTRTP